MATSLATITTRIKKYCAQCPEPMIEDLLIEAIQAFCKKTWALKHVFEWDVSASAINDSANDSIVIYTANLFPSKRPVGVSRLLVDDAEYDVEKMPFKNNLASMTLNTDTAKRYYDMPDTQQIRIYPFDAVAADLVVEVAFEPEDDISEIDTDLYVEHFEAWRLGTLAGCYEIPGQSWSNMALAKDYERRFEAACGNTLVRRHGEEGGRTKPKRKGFI
jgi:hypothetical protein